MNSSKYLGRVSRCVTRKDLDRLEGLCSISGRLSNISKKILFRIDFHRRQYERRYFRRRGWRVRDVMKIKQCQKKWSTKDKIKKTTIQWDIIGCKSSRTGLYNEEICVITCFHFQGPSIKSQLAAHQSTTTADWLVSLLYTLLGFNPRLRDKPIAATTTMPISQSYVAMQNLDGLCTLEQQQTKKRGSTCSMMNKNGNDYNLSNFRGSRWEF